MHFSTTRKLLNYASLQLADGANVSALTTVGNIRGNSQTIQQQIANLEQDSLSGDAALNTEVSVLNKINASNVLTLRTLQDANNLRVAALEQQVLQAKQQRDTDAANLNFAIQSPEIITVVRPRLARVAFLDRLGDHFSDWAALAAIRVPPGKPIVLARRPNNSLCILIDSAIVVYLRSIFLLGSRTAAANVYCIQLVATDAPVKNLRTASLRVKMPLSTLLDDRNW